MRLIDADEVKETIRHRTKLAEWQKGIIWALIDMHKTVDAVPVRHGKWLYGESKSGHDGYYCSQCGKHIRWIYGEEDINFIRSYNYCPNCGARMDEHETD